MSTLTDNAGLTLTTVTVIATLAGLAAGWIGLTQVEWLYLMAYLAGGVPSGLQALRSLVRERVLDIDLLMVVAALAAAAVGAAAEGAVLLALFSLSGTLEHRAMGRARKAVEALMELRPDTALVRRGDGVEEVSSDVLVPGDLVILRPGARVPVDGVLRLGSGALDEATITGESEPRRKEPGDALHEATVNLDAVLEMEVTRAPKDSTVARMIRLVTEAQAQKAPSERFSAWFGQRYTIAVLGGAVVAFAVLLLLGYPAEDALYKAAVLLVAASPCAIVISVPAAILSSLSAAARGGVLFKGGGALETLAEVRGFAFDKTGTLTTGRADVRQIVVPQMDEDAFLALLAGLEAQAEHPSAAAIRRAARARGLLPAPVTDVVTIASEGVMGRAHDGQVWAGNQRLAARHGATPGPEFAAVLDGDASVILMGQGARVLGAVAVADGLRPSASEGLEALRAGGVTEIAMMTGDRAPVAARVANALKIEQVHSGLLPGEKLDLVAAMAARGKVAFVGDGVNDAAALARADVGIAMGAAGSDVALQAADVALMSDDLTRLAEAHRLARRTALIIRQNLGFALGAMAVLVISGLFFDLPLPLAVLGHEGGTVLVVLNGLRLLADPIRHKGSGRTG